MAYQTKGHLPPSLTSKFNADYTDSNNSSTMHESQLSNAEHHKLVQDRPSKQTVEEFKVPQLSYHQQYLFLKQPNAQKCVRESIYAKLPVPNKRIFYSSTPTSKFVYRNTSQDCDISPIANKTIKHQKEVDELPSAKRLKTSKSERVPMAEISAERNYNHIRIPALAEKNHQEVDDYSVTSTTSETSSPAKKKTPKKDKFQKLSLSKNKSSQIVNNNVNTRKLISVPVVEHGLELDIVNRHEVMNSRNLKFDDSKISSNNKLSNKDKTHLVVPVLSPVMNRTMPSQKDKKTKEMMSTFDRAVGMSASVILISSDCSSSYIDQLSREEVVKAKLEASKKNISVNTTKGIDLHRTIPKQAKKSPKVAIQSKAPPKTVTKSTQKYDCRDISTNTSEPHKYDSDSMNVTLTEEKEKSRKSIGINTTHKSTTKVRCLSTYKKSKLKSKSSPMTSSSSKIVINSKRTSPQEYNISLQSLRVRTKTIDYSSCNFSSQEHQQDNTESIQTSRKSRKRKQTMIPPKLRATTKPKPKKERLSGFYQMEAAHNENQNESENSSNRNSKRKGRPTSLYIQSHVVGPGSLKKALLKKVASNNNTKRGSPVTHTSPKRNAGRSKRQTSSTSTDDSEFKKPFPVKYSRACRSSTTTSNASTVGGDREPLFNSQQIETISENPIEESINSNTLNNLLAPAELVNASVYSSPRTRKSSRTNSSTKASTTEFKHPQPVSESKTALSESGIGTASCLDIIQPSPNVDIQCSDEPSANSPLDDPIFEIQDSLEEPNSSQRRKQTSMKSNEKECSYNSQEVNKVPAATDRLSIKPRKSVTFCETVTKVKAAEGELRPTQRNSLLDNEEDGDNMQALAITDKRSRRVLADDSYLDSSDGEDNGGGICTYVNNQYLLLKKWNSDMPDPSSLGPDCVIKYTMKNVPFVNSSISSGCFTMGPGQQNPINYALKHGLFFQVLQGNAIINVQSIKINVKAGSHFVIPLGSAYSIKNARSDSSLILFFLKFKA